MAIGGGSGAESASVVGASVASRKSGAVDNGAENGSEIDADELD